MIAAINENPWILAVIFSVTLFVVWAVAIVALAVNDLKREGYWDAQADENAGTGQGKADDDLADGRADKGVGAKP